MRVRFLADANLDQDIVAGFLRREPEVDFELPQSIIPEGMTDPDVLAVAASLDRVRMMSARCRGTSESLSLAKTALV